MNIFEVLNRGKSRLYEPSMSSMIGYLLDSSENHGLGDIFLRYFLENINKSLNSKIFSDEFLSKNLKTEVSLEEPYKFNDKRFDIDIEVLLIDSSNKELFRIIIENKIKPTSASPEQLVNYYKAITADETNLENLLIIFLTPESSNILLKSEFENLILDKDKNHKKCWLYWSSNYYSITSLLKNILSKETIGEINPLNDYLKHTIKAFINFIEFLTVKTNSKTFKFGEDIGDIIEEKEIKLSDGTYNLIRRDSQQIQIFKNDEKVVAKEIMRKIIYEKKLNIKEEETYILTTRQLGKKILELL